MPNLKAAFIALFIAGLMPAGRALATDLHPAASFTSTNTITFLFDGFAGDKIAVLSDTSTFATIASSESFAAPVIGVIYSALDLNTTYYFEVKPKDEYDSSYSLASTATLASTAAFSGLTAVSENQALLEWDTGANPEWTVYQIDRADNPSFASAARISGDFYGAMIAGGLAGNATYYFRIRAANVAGTVTEWSPSGTAVTLADAPANVVAAAGLDSADISFTAAAAANYAVEVSTASDISGTVFSSQTYMGSAGAVSLRVGPLAENTTYFYKAYSLNRNNQANEADSGGFATLAPAVSGVELRQVYSGSATVSWSALASTSAAGYTLEASSTGFNGAGVVLSSRTYNTALSTLTVYGLLSNTGYSFRAGSLNWTGHANYGAQTSSVTLSLPVDINSVQTSAGDTSLVLAWSPLAASPQSDSCAGYIAQASTSNFSGGDIYFSSTSLSSTASLRVEGLTPNKTYYLRLGTYNTAGDVNYIRPPAKTTAVASARAALSATPGTSSLTVGTLAGNWTSQLCDGYIVTASTAADLSGVVFSSVTAVPGVTALSVSGLSPNTLYYIKAGAMFNGATSYAEVSPAYISTLSLPPDSRNIANVFYSSAALAWTFTGVAEGYIVRVSTLPGFLPLAYSYTTQDASVNAHTVTGLSPNTSYYFKVGTLNWLGASSDSDYVAATTRANPVLERGYDVWESSLTVNWGVNSNPDGTVYRVTLGGVTADTLADYARFTGLGANTSYYAVVNAVNSDGVVEGSTFSVVYTNSASPASTELTAVSSGSVSIGWDAATLSGTNYRLEISRSQDFAAVAVSTRQCVSSGGLCRGDYGFAGLVSNATYYTRIAPLNFQQQSGPYNFTYIGSTITLPAAPAVASGGAFSDVRLDALSAAWSGNGNAAGTSYLIQISSDSGFSASTYAYTAELGYTFTGLEQYTTYYARVRAEGFAGLSSSFVTLGSTQTLRSGSTQIGYGTAGSVTLPTSYGTFTLDVPERSFSAPVRIGLERNYSPPSAPAAVSGLAATGLAIDISVTPRAQPARELALYIPYRLADVAAYDRDKLIIATYDAAQNIWTPLPSVSDKTNNRVIARVAHLSTFQIMQASAQAAVSGARIFPNPFKPSKGHKYVQFANMPAYARVRIYTFLGERVNDLAADINGSLAWDVSNSYGQHVASGVYIVHIESGGDNKIMKLAVER